MFSSGRGTKSLDIRRASLEQRFGDKRRSIELGRSARRFDEAWGAGERADTRLKCADGAIHYVHSQVLSLWSSVLRNMLALIMIPGPQLLESTQGLAYVLSVDEDSSTWAAVLDMMYPVLRPAGWHSHVLRCVADWELLQRCLVLADKYDMPVVMQRLLDTTLLTPGAKPAYSLNPGQADFVLAWLSLSEQLQLPELTASILVAVQASMKELASQPGGMEGLMAYAQQHLSKELVLQLLQASMQQHATTATSQQPQQLRQQQPVASMPLVVLVPPTTPSCSWQQHPQQQGALQSSAWQAVVSGQVHAAAAAAAAVAAATAAGSAAVGSGSAGQHDAGGTVCSGTSCAEQDHDLDEAVSSTRAGAAAARASCSHQGNQQQHQERIALCQSSALFAPAVLLDSQQQQQQPPAQHFRLSNSQEQQQRAASLSEQPSPQVCVARQPQQPAAQQGLVGGCTYGFGVNAGRLSIDDWMRQSFPQHSNSSHQQQQQQPEGMCM